jgi:polysaccharide biosynthesis protein PelF
MSRVADVCLILEGTYPYVSGGVSTWTHELIGRQSHLNFHIVSILPKDGEVELKYDLPANVIGFTTVRLQHLPVLTTPKQMDMQQFHAPLSHITVGKATLHDLQLLLNGLHYKGVKPSESQLLDSEAAFALLTNMYEASFDENSFLDYFWSWRAIAGSLYSIMLADIPPAKVYHALSTGYAGLLAARAKMETGRPMVMTEHGIYTNERRIEIASADWLEDAFVRSLSIESGRRTLRDLWIDTFTNYSRIAYEAADDILTLYEGNQDAQMMDGADMSKMRVIPNGVDIERFSAIRPKPHVRPTVALIGRVVPIKDIKSFLRACANLQEHIPDLRAYVMGPTEEDEKYYAECMEVVTHLGLEHSVEFTGQVKIDDYLGEIDVIVISSISEAQPLVILEAGAAGIPCVSTDVGACREMIEGHPDESPALGRGGEVVPLSNPTAIANALLRLLSDRHHYADCSAAIRQRVATYYTKEKQHASYRALYDAYVQAGRGNPAQAQQA